MYIKIEMFIYIVRVFHNITVFTVFLSPKDFFQKHFKTSYRPQTFEHCSFTPKWIDGMSEY